MVALGSNRTLRFTTHAVVRCQQRGFSEQAVELVVTHGQAYHAGDGARAYFLGTRAVVEAKRRHGINLDRWRGSAVIVSQDDAIVTVQRVTRPKRTWRGHR